SIHLVMADTDLTPFDMGTFGSRTTPDMANQLRRVAAAARESLLDFAAESLKTDRSKLTVAEGKVSFGNQTTTFGKLAKGRQWVRPISSSIPVKEANQWDIAGTSVPKVDSRDLVTGRHQYSSDISRPEMVHGKILRPES